MKYISSPKNSNIFVENLSVLNLIDKFSGNSRCKIPLDRSTGLESCDVCLMLFCREILLKSNKIGQRKPERFTIRSNKK